MTDVIVALLTPFRADGGVDRRALTEHVRFLVDARVDGLMTCGTTGEGPLLEEEEIIGVVEATVEAAERVPVMAHIGRPSTGATLRLAREAIRVGASAVSAVVPYFYALEDDALLRHYRSLLDASDVPVYAYTIPSFSGNELPAPVVATLAGEGLAGIKDSTKSMDRHGEYLAVARERRSFRVLMGSDGLVLAALRAGASGVVSALANARPELLVRLAGAVEGGLIEEAQALQDEVSALRERTSTGPPLSAYKALTAEALIPGDASYPTVVRPPLG